MPPWGAPDIQLEKLECVGGPYDGELLNVQGWEDELPIPGKGSYFREKDVRGPDVLLWAPAEPDPDDQGDQLVNA